LPLVEPLLVADIWLPGFYVTVFGLYLDTWAHNHLAIADVEVSYPLGNCAGRCRFGAGQFGVPGRSGLARLLTDARETSDWLDSLRVLHYHDEVR